MKIKLPHEYMIIWSDTCGGTHTRTVSQERLACEVDRLDREIECCRCTGYTITALGRITA